MISSTELIRQWEEKELPMLREKDFRGDAERMAYTAFGDGFAFGVYASRLTWQDIQRIVKIADQIVDEDRGKFMDLSDEDYYKEVLARYVKQSEKP